MLELMHSVSGRRLFALGIGLVMAAFFLARAFLTQDKPPSGKSAPVPANPNAKAAEKAAERAKDAVLAYARKRLPSAKAFTMGAVDIDPKHLAIWITTDTDAQRDALMADAAFEAGARRAVADSGYPEQAVPSVGFAFESEETVSRDHGGNWWMAVK